MKAEFGPKWREVKIMPNMEEDFDTILYAIDLETRNCMEEIRPTWKEMTVTVSGMANHGEFGPREKRKKNRKWRRNLSVKNCTCNTKIIEIWMR